MADAYVLAVFKVGGRVASNLLSGSHRNAITDLEGFLQEVNGGKPNVTGGFIVVDDSGTEPAGAIAVTATNVSADQTVTFTIFDFDVVLTVGDEIELDTTSDTTQATALKEAIEAHALLGNVLTVSQSTGTLTITAKFPGDVLENITMATSAATAFGLTQIGAGTNGVDGDAQYFFRGKKHNG